MNGVPLIGHPTDTMAHLHRLACQIDHAGPCSAQEYFLVEEVPRGLANRARVPPPRETPLIEIHTTSPNDTQTPSLNEAKDRSLFVTSFHGRPWKGISPILPGDLQGILVSGT